MTRQRGHGRGGEGMGGESARLFGGGGERKNERHPERGYEGAEEGRPKRGGWSWKRIVG